MFGDHKAKKTIDEQEAWKQFIKLRRTSERTCTLSCPASLRQLCSRFGGRGRLEQVLARDDPCLRPVQPQKGNILGQAVLPALNTSADFEYAGIHSGLCRQRHSVRAAYTSLSSEYVSFGNEGQTTEDTLEGSVWPLEDGIYFWRARLPSRQLSTSCTLSPQLQQCSATIQ